MNPENASAGRKRKRGRPRKRETKVISIRLSPEVYDRYCQYGFYVGKDVATAIRETLTVHAPLIIRSVKSDSAATQSRPFPP